MSIVINDTAAGIFLTVKTCVIRAESIIAIVPRGPGACDAYIGTGDYNKVVLAASAADVLAAIASVQRGAHGA